MILFAADNHYGTHAGQVSYGCLREHYDIAFHEDDWSCFHDDLRARYDLLILHMIAGTCGIEPPDTEAEKRLKDYVQAGGNMLLLHGSSAAFWPWDWWRPLVGYRWVRGADPDGIAPSTHPRRPCRVAHAKGRHPLIAQLREFDLPEDEIYIRLEQTCPTITLLETTTDEGTFPMCYETTTPWGGRIIGYLPGHEPNVVRLADNVTNCRVLIDWLLKAEA